jgi:uncharacterized protein involved in outer membrane biogenesis
MLERAVGNAGRKRPNIGDNGLMKSFVKWVVIVLVTIVVLLAAVAFALRQWIGTDDFRTRVSQQISTAAGVPVQLGHITIDVWPLPAVAVDRVEVKSQPPLTLERIEARPIWAGLLQRRLEVATIVVRNAVIPEPAVTAIAAGISKRKPATASQGEQGAGGIEFLPRRVVLDRVSWVDAKGASTTVDAQVVFDDDHLPGAAQLQVRKGRFEGTKATLDRKPDHWLLRADIGGGTVEGKFQVKQVAKGGWNLQGQLETAKVDVAALTAPSRTLTGRLEAHTTLHSDFREPGAIVDALQSQTRFTVHNAVVHGIDLAQAVKTVGLSRGGETKLDTLAGNVNTQGRAVQLNNLVATSGILSADGNVAMAANRTLSGRVTVNLASAAVGGAVGVPLSVGGTLDAPSVQLTKGALLGAAIGTAIAPGLGTGAGAKAGDKVGEKLRSLFGK